MLLGLQISCYDMNLNEKPSTFLFKKNKDFSSFELDSEFSSTPALNSTNNPFMFTLELATLEMNYYILFNDETPNGTESSSRAHEKGILAFDPEGNNGVYLHHSTPRFPDPETFAYEERFNTYGEHFACFELSEAQFEQMGRMLYTTNPQIYTNTFDMRWLESHNTPLYDLLSGRHEEQPVFAIEEFGDYTMFYKNSQAGIEIWSEIAKYYEKDFFVETWLRDTAQEAYCGDFRVEMAGVIEILGVSWKETQDHSKWGISQRGDVFCVGDNNFQASQMKRGGATFCGVDWRKAEELRQAIVSLSEKVVCKDQGMLEEMSS